MAIINQSNILNLQPGITAPVVVHMSEGDSGTKLSFKLIDGARAWTDPGNVVAAVHGRRQDGTQFGPYACTISGDVVSFQTDAAIAAVAGSGIAQIVLTDSDQNTAGTANFAIMVERATFPMGVTYTNDVSVYEAILSYVQTIPAAVTGDYTAKIAAEAAARATADANLENNINTVQGALSTEISNRTTQDAVLSARMDEFTKLPDGSMSTAADAELVDIRVKADGTKASTAGNAVREQITELKNKIDDVNANMPTDSATGAVVQLDGNNSITVISIDTESTSGIKVTRCGKNLNAKFESGSANSLTWTVDSDGIITFSGTPSADITFCVYTYIPVGIYTVAMFNNMYGTRLTAFYVTSGGNVQMDMNSANNTTLKLTFTYPITEIRIRVPKDFAATGLTLKPYIQIGDTVESFIPYSGQTYDVTIDANGIVQEDIQLQSGLNSIWSNSGDVTIKTLTSVMDYVDNSIDALQDYVDGKFDNLEIEPKDTTFFDASSHNMINPANIDKSLYFSPATGKIATATSDTANALTGLIEVEEGEIYTVSGTARGTSVGGYFTSDAVAESGQSAVATTTYFNPVTGDGKCFTVPTGQNIKYVGLNLLKNTTTQEIDGTYQLEKGEMATEIVPYQPVYKIDEQYLPDNSGGSETDVSPVDLLPEPSYSHEYSKIESFLSHWVAKDKDLMVVGTGTSLTARSSEHCTVRSDATSRPPLLHSNNFASKIWDRIKWEGQEYRRFDYMDFFTETGTFSQAHDNSDWDDAYYRYGLTRYATGPASVAFTIPEDAWQFNFIYRTDTAGSESVSVTVAEGNGKVEAFNGSAWVEANGYTFSMRESVVNLSNIEVCNPNTVSNSKVAFKTYQVGGNTTYQRRLKMRCKSGTIDSRESTKAVTISASSGRLLYWGVEWSPREFMITYVNAARGSHNMSYTGTTSLLHFQDNEIWSFKPDLIFSEIPIHNSGAGGANFSSYYTTYWGYITNDFFFNTDNPVSLVERAEANGLTVDNIEWILFNSSVSWNFGGINDDGTLKLSEDKNGRVLTCLDVQSMTWEWLRDNKTNVVAINAMKYWCNAGVKIFGDMKTATVGSGKDGNTLTNEGGHWNDTGCAVMDRCIGGVFDFYN